MRRGVGVGAFFVVAGVLFFLDALDAIELRAAYLWPLLLIGLGLAIMLGGWARRREAPREPPEEAVPDGRPGAEEHPGQEPEGHTHEPEAGEPHPGEPEEPTEGDERGTT